MITQAKKTKIAVQCLIFSLIIFALVICSFIVNSVYNKQITEVYIEDNVTTYYSGEPIINPFCIFLYLTTQNSLFIGVVMLLLSLSIFFKNKFLEKYLLNNNIWAYISMIYIFMFLAVLIFDIITGFKVYKATILNFGFSFISVTILLNRFVLHHALVIWFFILLKNIYPNKISLSNKANLIMPLYYIFWYLLINIIGNSMSPYHWFPYILIVPQGFFEFCNISNVTGLLTVVYYVVLVSLLFMINMVYYLFRRLLNFRTKRRFSYE